MIAKVFERLLGRQTYDAKTRILHDGVSAYRINYNCQSVLIHAVETWRKALDQKKHVGILLMDLSKAFDLISHPLLIAKLHAYGFGENAIKLLASYLTGCSQKVRLLCSNQNSLIVKCLKNVFHQRLVLVHPKCYSIKLCR